MMVSKKKDSEREPLKDLSSVRTAVLPVQALGKPVVEEPDYVEIKAFNIYRVEMRLPDKDWEVKFNNANQTAAKQEYDKLSDRYVPEGYQLRMIECYESFRQKKLENSMSRYRVWGERILHSDVAGEKDQVLFEKEEKVV